MPSLWNLDGTPAIDIEPEVSYEQLRQWDWHPPYHGYRATFPTAQDDFDTPYTPTIEEELEDLI